MNISVFTYFKDRNNFVFYANRSLFPGEEYVNAILVYVPYSKKLSDRYQSSSQMYYKKQICHGYEAELRLLQQSMPTDMYHIIASLCKKSSVNSEQYLHVRIDQIVEIYDPVLSLDALYDGVGKAYDIEVTEKIRYAVGILEANGISRKLLGLYGGLQCGITNKESSSIKDIDLFITSTDAYSNVLTLSRGNELDTRLLSPYINSKDSSKAAAIRRGQLSQFILPGYSDVTTVDMRLIDKMDTSIYTYKLMAFQPIKIEGARVTQAHQSLGFPVRYKVRDNYGCDWDVLSSQYQHIGAATVDDRVSISGILVNAEKTILLVDPDVHWIFSPSALGQSIT